MNARKWAGVVLSALLGLFSAAGVSAATWTTGPYVYDGAGNIKSIGSSELYQYDALGRLTYGQIGPGQTQSVQYDRYGNVTSLTTGDTQITIGVDAQTNRITVPANVYANYDAAGRVISTPSGSDAFTYDATDMVMRSTVSGSTKVHIYTVNDERLATLTPGSTEQSEWTVRDPGGRILRRFERAGGTWTWKQDYIYAGDRLLASDVDTSAGTLYYFPDHLGTPRLITGNGGVKVSFHTYYPFGVEATASGQDAEKRKFTGHERDYDSLDCMHARYYRPHWGRFLSVDPVLDLKKAAPNPQGWNRYSYVRNNPVNRTDPDGRDDIWGGPGTPQAPPEISAQGAKITVAAIAIGVTAYYAPTMARALFSWALGNPNQATQVANAVLSAPGPGAMPNPEAIGAAIGSSVAGQATGKMAAIAGQVSATGMSQAGAATAVNSAVQAMGLRTTGVVAVGENLVVGSVVVGTGKQVMVIDPQGIVRQATATIDIAKKTADIIIKDIQYK